MSKCAFVAVLALLLSSETIAAQSSRQGPAGRQMKHVSVSVAATNDEWTPLGITVAPGDLVIVQASGTVRYRSGGGEVDAIGALPGNASSANSGALQMKVGAGAGKLAGKSALHVSEESGELKLRVIDNRYEDNSGMYEVDVIILPVAALPPVVKVSAP